MINRILVRFKKKKPVQNRGKIEVGLNTSFNQDFVTWHSEYNFISIGQDSLINSKVIYEHANAKISIGSRTFIGGGTKLIAAESITIGDDILISWGVTIVDHNSHAISFSKRKDDVINWGKGIKDWSHVKIEPVVIGNKCWVGFDVIILKGVHLGEGCIVAAGSVVTKSFPAWSVIGGNPAKLIRTLGEDER